MKFYIIATRVSLDGYPESYNVGYDNTATTDCDNYMFFDSREQAENWTQSKEAKEWKDCTFEIVENTE